MLTVIDRTVQARLCMPAAGGRTISATLSYHCDDPYAAYLTFPASASLDGTDVTWVFARNLLAAGLRGPAGDGDVHVWPCGPHRTMVELRSLDGAALIEFPGDAVRDFLARSYSAVPAGEEHSCLDTDSVLAALLGEE